MPGTAVTGAPGVVRTPDCGDTVVQPSPQPWTELPDAVHTTPPVSAMNNVMGPGGMVPSGAGTVVTGAPAMVLTPGCDDTLDQPYSPPQPWAGVPDAVYTLPLRSAMNNV